MNERITEHRINEINQNFADHLKDSGLRIRYGLRTRLLDYQDKVLFLEINVYDGWKYEGRVTCRNISRNWRSSSNELKDSIDYHVVYKRYFYHDSKSSDQDTIVLEQKEMPFIIYEGKIPSEFFNWY